MGFGKLKKLKINGKIINIIPYCKPQKPVIDEETRAKINKQINQIKLKKN